MSDALLQLQQLSVDYKVKGGYLSAVHGVNLSIGKGEIFALVGESGCGKSTVAHSILSLLNDGNAKTSGQILFHDQNLNGLRAKEIERIRGGRIGMIFQNPLDSLNPVYTVGRQVMEAIQLDGVDKASARKRALELFQEVKLPDPEACLDRFPHELSGGMRQRVMIAMMISRRPELLIADEPTTALDVTIEANILRILKQLRDENGTSILLITHNFGLVAEIADRIGVMYAGELIETGNVYEVFRNPQHPYTRLLMKALPKHSKWEGRLETIDGTVPRITEIRGNCRFSGRCPYAGERCGKETPVMKTVGEDHMCSCFLTEGGETP